MTIVNGLKAKIIFLDDLDRKDEVERNKELEAEWEKRKKRKGERTMKTFIRIVSGKNGAEVEEKVNGIAQEQGVEIVTANSFMWQGVIYTTVTFADNPIEKLAKSMSAVAKATKAERASAKKEVE